MSKTLKYYYDFFSQPSRAMYIILKMSGTNFEKCPIDLKSGQHYTEEFENINRFQRVPCIEHGDIKLAESVAILRYLHRQGMILEKLYPIDLIKQARVDEFLEWQHLNIRLNGFLYFRYKVLRTILTGQEPNEQRVALLESHLNKSLDNIENIWLKSTNYITSNELTAADIFAACEIEQPKFAGVDPCKNRPKLKEWLRKVRNEADPYYKEAHSIFENIKELEGIDHLKYKL